MSSIFIWLRFSHVSIFPSLLGSFPFVKRGLDMFFSHWLITYLRKIGSYMGITWSDSYNTPPQKPASRLVLYSGYDAINGDQYCSVTAPISPFLATGGPTVKNGATLIAPEGGTTRRIWRPPCCGDWWLGCRPHCNHLATEAYLQYILPHWRKYRGGKGNSKSAAIFTGQ